MFNVELSSLLEERSLKVLLWGEAGSRKTETILRHFPSVLLIDCEGNSDQCIGEPEINPFLRVVTKDIYEILAILDKVAIGELTFPDGTQIQTVGIDGLSVLWSVRQEVGAMHAEGRLRRGSRGDGLGPDDVTMTQLDWVHAKRPLKRLYARMNVPNVKYFVVTAREKDDYEEKNHFGRMRLVKVGKRPDAMRGIEYEVNIAVHMQKTSPWKCEVTKVQGALGNEFPIGSVLTEFPHARLLEYANGGGTSVDDDVSVAERQLAEEEPRTKQDLVEFGAHLGVDPRGIASALEEAGLVFDAGNWKAMEEAVSRHAHGSWVLEHDASDAT